MVNHDMIADNALFHMLRRGMIAIAGNRQLKIFGTLKCLTGKRMKRSNRMFFVDVAEARRHGFRPCGHCMRQLYREWKFRKSSVAGNVNQAAAQTDAGDIAFDEPAWRRRQASCGPQ